MTADALYSLADRSILFAALQSRAWNAAVATLGEHRWDVDVEARTVTFSAVGEPTRRLVAPAELIATVSGGTVLWGWSHPQGSPDGAAARLRAHGEEHGIAALTSAHSIFSADYTASPETWHDDTAMVLGLVATEITGKAPVFVAPSGGVQAIFLLDVPLPVPTVADATATLPEVLSSLPLRDARTSMWGLARLAGWHFEWTDAAYGSARIADASGAARLRFDEAARISAIDPEPAAPKDA